MQAVVQRPWIPAFGIEYLLGVDGISMPLVVLTTFLSMLAAAASFRESLASVGVATAGRGQIVPVVVGAAGRAVAVSKQLAEAGLFVPAIRPPSVPEGASLVRASLAWHHTAADRDRLVAAIAASLRHD